MKQEIVSTEKIVIEISLLGQTANPFSTVTGRKKTVRINGETVYEEYESYPQFSRTTKTGVLLNDLQRHLSFRQQTKSCEQRRSKGGDFVHRVKVVWSKLLFQVVHFKK